MKHCLSVKDFGSREEIEEIFALAARLQDRGIATIGANRYQIATLFMEPSTRTRLSFEAAANKLGWSVLSVPNKEISSWTKGESLQDCIKTVSQYADCIVLRCDHVMGAKIAADVSDCPIINAGDGGNEHPTQALLDAYTIWREKGTIDGLKIHFVGDLEKARTIRSLRALLENNYEVKITSNTILGEDGDFMSVGETPFKANLYDADVVYVTRVQQERYEKVPPTKRFVGVAELPLFKKDAIIMHPLPRKDELSAQLDNDPRAAYFRQVKNGLYVRAALLMKLVVGF